MSYLMSLLFIFAGRRFRNMAYNDALTNRLRKALRDVSNVDELKCSMEPEKGNKGQK